MDLLERLKKKPGQRICTKYPIEKEAPVGQCASRGFLRAAYRFAAYGLLVRDLLFVGSMPEGMEVWKERVP